MAYNTKPIVTDVDGNPISQYYNKELDQYEPVEGQAGANKVVLYNADGTENNSLSLVPILDKLSQLTGTVIDEETRKSNELQRIALYNQISQMLTDGELKGDKGDIGRGLEYHWDGTMLGVRVEGETQYIYVDLKGDKGDKGEQGIQGSQGIQGAKGDKGDPGDSAYQVWLSQGNTGTIEEYLASLKGAKGDKGDKGDPGQDGTGTGDMLKSIYDTNDDGIVDNAEKLQGKTLQEIYADIPPGYTHPDTHPASMIMMSDETSVEDKVNTHLADTTTAHGIDVILSKLNNLNANDSEVRKELLDLKLKLDEKDVIDFISSKSGIGFYDLFTNNDYVDTANTTATIANTNVTFQGSKVLKMKPQNFDNFSKLELAVYDKNREKIAADESSTNSITIKSSIGIGSMTAGDELFYKGVTYTVQSVAEA